MKHKWYTLLIFAIIFVTAITVLIEIPTNALTKINSFNNLKYILPRLRQYAAFNYQTKDIKDPNLNAKQEHLMSRNTSSSTKPYNFKPEKSILKNTNFSTQFDTFKGIQDFIWNRLNDLQDEGDCENKKLLYCATSSLAGLGSLIFRFRACLQISFALGRTLFIYQKEYQHFGGLNKWMKLESKRCGYLREKYRNYGNICNLKDRKCYLNGNVLEVNNIYKVLEIDMIGIFPMPRYIPTTIPSFIEHALKKLKMKEP